jgi:hypothetical protein
VTITIPAWFPLALYGAGGVVAAFAGWNFIRRGELHTAIWCAIALALLIAHVLRGA